MPNPDPKAFAVIGAFILLAFLADLVITFHRNGIFW